MRVEPCTFVCVQGSTLTQWCIRVAGCRNMYSPAKILTHPLLDHYLLTLEADSVIANTFAAAIFG